eukprot:TRINITY_DN72221_c0_g1_i1.p1 TRINITY_DN72221_c0_g1~~TRINITY_DN72221_c0_g1_i1.p1  ORF type:complete len:249 (+),score=53.72 TRINITY_DN72221_c0_g1_i1:60-806(+)
MVIPLGGLGGSAGPEALPEVLNAPKEVREHYAIWWWALFYLFSLVAVAEAVAGDVAGALHGVIMTIFVWYLARNDCENMSQCCVLFSGVMCLSYLIIDVWTAAETYSHGRVTEHQKAVTEDTGKQVVTITTERKPFWDPTAGNYYQFQSAMLIVTCVPMLYGVLVSYLTYRKYPLPLSEALASMDQGGGNGENTPFSGGGGYGGGGRAMGGSYGGGGGGGGAYGGGRPNAAPQGPVLFGGSGQRLGSG